MKPVRRLALVSLLALVLPVSSHVDGFTAHDGRRRILAPDNVTTRLTKTAIDIGKKGVDKCFGSGRIDALRAVKNDTKALLDKTAPYCPEYME